MADPEKADRTKKKRAVTKQVNHVRQLIAESDDELIVAEVEKLKGLFKDFVTANEKYEENIETGEDLDESESYFTLVQNEYINTLTAANDYKRNKPQVVETEQKMTNSDLLKIMNLPKLTLENFDGNPVNFHTFTHSTNMWMSQLPMETLSYQGYFNTRLVQPKRRSGSVRLLGVMQATRRQGKH